MRARAHHLYRHFDVDGKLLYVGQSVSAFERFRAHRTSTKWANRAALMRVECFESREAACAAEIRAIREEKPTFNVVGAIAEVCASHGEKLSVRDQFPDRSFPFQIRLTEQFLTKVDDWRRKQPDLPSRSEAIRRIVEMHLAGLT